MSILNTSPKNKGQRPLIWNNLIIDRRTDRICDTTSITASCDALKVFINQDFCSLANNTVNFHDHMAVFRDSEVNTGKGIKRIGVILVETIIGRARRWGFVGRVDSGADGCIITSQPLFGDVLAP
jgi:hypothetical protein